MEMVWFLYWEGHIEAVGIKNLCIKKNNIYLELYQASTFICRAVAALELS